MVYCVEALIYIMVVPGRKTLTAPIGFSSKTEEKQKGLTNGKLNHSKKLCSIYTSLNRSYLRSLYVKLDNCKCKRVLHVERSWYDGLTIRSTDLFPLADI